MAQEVIIDIIKVNKLWKNIWRDANECWNNHNWENSKYKKANAEPIPPKDIVMEYK